MDASQNFTHGSHPFTSGHNTNFMVNENIADAVRRKIPERITNVKGTGAYGKFTVTHDISLYCKASLFSDVGNECRLFARFSAMHGEKGSADTERDVRGFALKLYTQEGNWDLVGNNMPVFSVKDAANFPSFMRSQGRNFQTNMKSATAMWDFHSQHPETLHQLLMLMSDRGKPAGYRYMHGFGTHTFSMINAQRERFWVKFHLKSKQGIKNFDGYEVAGSDFAHADLVEVIEKGEFPQWTMFIQVMTEEQANTSRWNPFDVTKVWLHDEFPLIEVGELELNEIPKNYFTHVEQATFSPANIIPGIGFSSDPMLQARLFSYTDAQRHRVGINSKELDVNQSLVESNAKYFADELRSTSTVNLNNIYENEDDHYTQPGLFYTKALRVNIRERLIQNLVDAMKEISGPTKDTVINRQLCHFFRANIELGVKIATGLQVNIDANMMGHTFDGGH